MVTVHASPNGVRIGIVTPHGPEELLKADLETRIMAVKLWERVMDGPLEGHAAVFPETNVFAARLQGFQTDLENLHNRITDLEDRAAKAILHAIHRPDPGGR